MAFATILYWRDIPAQVIVKRGRVSAKRELAARFQEAVDMAAMRGKAIGTDAYLADWRRSDPVECSDDLEAEAQAWQDKLEATYDDALLAALVAAFGYAKEPQP
ncbi:MAG: virulence factor [Rhodospirillales bacterium]